MKKQNKKGKSSQKGRNGKSGKPLGRGKTYSAPSAVGRVITSQEPSIARNGNSTVIRFREFVQDVAAKTSFTVSAHSINAGNASLFPWLSPQALQYEAYNFRRLHFEFETACGSETIGSVMLAVDYDPADAAPSTKQELLTNADAARSSPWLEFELVCSPKRLRGQYGRYFTADTVPLSQDKQLYNIGTLYLGVQGCDASIDGDSIGELWVSYDVELITPQLNTSGDVDTSHFAFLTSGSEAVMSATTGSAITALLYTDRLICELGSLTYTVPTNTTLSGFPKGAYCIQGYITAITSAASDFVTDPVVEVRKNGVSAMTSAARPEHFVNSGSTDGWHRLPLFFLVVISLLPTDILSFAINTQVSSAGNYFLGATGIQLAPAA